MSGVPQQNLVAKDRLTPADFVEVEQLVRLCNAYEGLEIKLNWEMMRTRAGNAPSDFCFYASGSLVGYAPLDGFSDQHEVTVLVHPEFRCRGIARSLIGAAVDEARRRATRLLLVCERASASGQAFVAAMGAQRDFSEYHMQLDAAADLPAVSGEVELRPAEVVDAALLTRLQALSFGDSEESLGDFVARELASPHSRAYIATLAGEPIGRIGVFLGEHDAYIRAFGVLPHYRGRGYGRQILAATVQAMLAENRSPITLDVEIENQHALALYESCGFREQNAYDYFPLDLEPNAPGTKHVQ